MATLSPRNLTQIKVRDPRLGELLEDVVAGFNNLAAQTVAQADGATPAPPAPAALTVIAQDGVFDAVIQDNAPVYRGINYFLEYSLTANFQQPHVIDLGAARTWRGLLGNQTFYWRAYSQYPTSPPSAWVYGAGAVKGGGVAGPAPQASTGSGTAGGNGLQGGSGFGVQAFRSASGRPPTQ